MKRKIMLENFDWNKLPNELKMMCIRRMDFRTATMLRSTSKPVRALVDSERFQWNAFTIHLGASISRFRIDNYGGNIPIYLAFVTSKTEESEKEKLEKALTKTLSFLRHVLSRSEMGRIDLYAKSHCIECEHAIARFIDEGPTIFVRALFFQLTMYCPLEYSLLRKCDGDFLKLLKVISVVPDDEDRKPMAVAELLSYPAVSTVPMISFMSEEEELSIKTTVDFMYEGWGSIGQTLMVENATDTMWDAMLKEFNEDIIRIHETQHAFRLMTFDNSKHAWFQYEPHYIYAKFISSDDEDPEFPLVFRGESFFVWDHDLFYIKNCARDDEDYISFVSDSEDECECRFQ